MDSIYLTVQDKQITLTIKLQNERRSLTLHLLTNDSIQTVKQQIYLRENIPINQQILHLNERYLSNEHILSYYDILENATLHLMVGPIPSKPSDEMVIFIEIEALKTLTLTVTQNHTVQSVKQMIFQLESFEVHRQYLVFNEKELENERDLSHYRIENNSKLYLFLTVQQSCGNTDEHNHNSQKKSNNRNNHKKKKNKTKKQNKSKKQKKAKNRKNIKQQQTKSKKRKTESAVSGFERMDFGLNLYYESMNRKDYRNECGVGKFIKWAEENGFDADGLEEEFDDIEECNYVNFDDHFPLKHSYSDLECDEVKIYKILRHCHTHGYPPGYPVSKYVQKLNESLNKHQPIAKSINTEMINNQKMQTELNELAEERINLQWEKEENVFYQRAERALDVLWRYHQFEILKKEQICFNARYYAKDKNPMRQLEVTLLDKVDTLHRFFIAHMNHERKRKKTHVEREADGYILQLNQLNNTQFYIKEKQNAEKIRAIKRGTRSHEDGCGIVYAIATSFNKQAWSIPSDKIDVCSVDEWIILDFSPKLIKPSCCSLGILRNRNTENSMTLEGSCDNGINWKRFEN